MKKFNVTGLCIPERHYMVNINNKVSQILAMIEEGLYFTINRPRQYGKTTTMFALTKALRDRYVVIDTSFEGIGDDMFQTEEVFCSQVFEVFAQSVNFTNKELSALLLDYSKEISNFKALSGSITKLITALGKDVVLIIDEVDKSSVNKVFMQFLGVLRNKYLAQSTGKDLTFKSVILGGVNDIKNMKLQIREEKDRVFNSPWNVASDFKVDMSFSEEEIENMLSSYSKETSIHMDTEVLAKHIRFFTSGYPYLVSRICKNIDEYLDKDWTIEGVEKAIRMTLKEPNTLFDDVIKNIENNKDIKEVVNEMLIKGTKFNYNYFAYEKGVIYGLFSEKDNNLIIHNKIFEKFIYNYLLEKDTIRRIYTKFTNVEENQFIKDGKLNMEKCLLKFQEVMYEEYRAEDESFYETQGRLVFLAFLKPILNGKGFSFVEPQTRQKKRMDVVITYGNEKFVVELKIWNGEKYEEKGLTQLKDYLDIQNLNSGYMIIFNFNKNKQYSANWIEVQGKKIFEVIL